MNKTTEKVFTNLIHKLELWFKENTQLPVLDIIDAYHQVGKHFVPNELHSVLVKIRDKLIVNPMAETDQTKQLLNMLLDKYDNNYDYRSYLGLELLKLPDIYEETVFCTAEELDRKVLLLGYDIMRFELAALNGSETWLPLMPTNEDLVTNRCRRVLKALAFPLQRLQIIDTCHEDNIIKHSQKLCEIISLGMTSDERLRLIFTNIPVHTVHDEYLFIRVLQCFETIFTWIVVTLKSAIAIGKNDISQVTALVNQCSLHIFEAFPLFTLLSTLRPEAFKEFRSYTEGASAIQSRSYKKIESLCRKPDQDRLDSIAYHSVPEVRELALGDRLTLDDVYQQIISSAQYSDEGKLELSAALTHFETELHRWRMMHHGLAVRMLGANTTTGTGYTAGTPYLKAATKIPVFTATKV